MRINPPGRILKNIKRIKKYGIYSPSICLEASSVCQLRCPHCNQVTGDKGITTGGFLSFENFRRFVDNQPEFERIELSCWGEPFLNPQMDEIIAYADSKNVRLSTAAGTNFNSISEQTIENLVKYRFRHVTVALDGATPEVYSIYRRGGDFDKVISNIRLLNKFKEKYNSPLPELRWQFIVFGHNEHEVDMAEKMASDLNMKFSLKLNTRPGYSPVKNEDFLRKKIGAASSREYRQRFNKSYTYECSAMWIAPQITWEGKLRGCCVNKWGDYGNVFESGLLACIKSRRYKHAKKMVTGKAEDRDDIPCHSCGCYTHHISKGAVYYRPDLRELAIAVLKR